VIARSRITGVINVQHRETHFHTGDEMELLTMVGEQVGALVALSLLDGAALKTPAVLDSMMTSARSG